MRGEGCTVQQAFAPEAANVVRQAITLAEKRGHAQVTPLHVAHTMLTASAGLFRTACLQSNSHPLQSRALELCFNVALNRLPASTSNPMLGPRHSQYPSISNALVAAFKRAQAHQRRGSIENQQQPLLAVKIELEQLMLSILDDPSVSRVMKEAGFSSTQVKSNVEQAISAKEISSRNPSVSPKSKESNILNQTQSPAVNRSGQAKGNLTVSDPVSEDAMYVIGKLVSRKRQGTVIVGESLSSIEGVVKGVIDKVEKGDVPETLQNVKFINLSLSSIRHRSRIEIEEKIEEIKSLLKSGIFLFLGDLKWAVEYRASPSLQGRSSYSPIEHIMTELGKLTCGCGDNLSFWLVGIATFQDYMRYKDGDPSLEHVLSLHPLTIPAESLRLTLVTDSALRNDHTASHSDKNMPYWILLKDGEENENQLQCCADCPAEFETETQSLQSRACNSDSPSSVLPTWLQQYKNKTGGQRTSDQYIPKFKELNSENLKTLCDTLEKRVPWQKDIIPQIASTILRCRSGLVKREGNTHNIETREETWLLFQGVDVEAKENIARELAKLVFGSEGKSVLISLSSFSSSRTDSSTDDYRKKRSRGERSGSCIDRFAEAVSSYPHRVFLIKDVEEADYSSQMGFKKAIKRGRVTNSDGEDVCLRDAIIILSCENFSSRLGACSPPLKQRTDCWEENGRDVEETRTCVSLDLNVSLDHDYTIDRYPSIDDIRLPSSVDALVVFGNQEFR